MHKQFQRLKHNGTIRDPNSLENLEFARQINEQIDIMIEYRPYNQVISSFRASLASLSGIYKKHALQLLDKSSTYIDNTTLGELRFSKVPSMSARRELLDIALERLQVNLSNIEDNIRNLPKMRRFVVKFDTVAIRLLPEVCEKVGQLHNEFFTLLDSVKADHEMDKFIASAIRWIQNNLEYNSSYTKAYNQAKSIFSRASSVHCFPRIYSYKGVILDWLEVQAISTFTTRINTYLQMNDLRLHYRLKKTLDDIRREKNEYRVMYTLDNFDFDSDVDYNLDIDYNYDMEHYIIPKDKND